MRAAWDPTNGGAADVASQASCAPDDVNWCDLIPGVDAARKATAQPSGGVAPGPSLGTAAVWAVDQRLTTLSASPGFAALVGIDPRVLSGMPWFVIVRPTSLNALEWLVDTVAPHALAELDLRHSDGHVTVVWALRVCGGPSQGMTVLRVAPRSRVDAGRAHCGG